MSTPDAEAPLSLEEQLAAMTPEQRAEAEALMVDRLMMQPIPLPTRWTVGTMDANGPAVIVDMQTPAGQLRVVLPRDKALHLASEIRKAAQTGPGIVVAQPGQVPGL